MSDQAPPTFDPSKVIGSNAFSVVFSDVTGALWTVSIENGIAKPVVVKDIQQ